MALLARQFGIATESSATYGGLVTVSRFYPFIEESLAQEIERIESAGVIPGTVTLGTTQWRPGNVSVSGDVSLELYQQGSGLLFTHMLGTVASSTAGGVATHTFTPGELTNLSFTAQVGRPMTTGVVVPFTYGGCKVGSWELAGAAGEIVTLGLSVIAQSETTGVSLASASYITGADVPYTMIDGALTIGGSTACVRNFTLSGENNLADDRRCIGQNYIDQPLEEDLHEYMGTLTMEFSSTAHYQRFTGGTTAAVVLALSASSSAQVTMTLNARFDGSTPLVTGKDLIVHDVPFKLVRSSTTDASAITAVMKNSQTAP